MGTAGEFDAAHAQRRFGGVARLIGEAAFARVRAAHVVVVGIGGVGSWTVEALARSGIGALTLIDMDHVAESNVNRQIHALDSTLGAAKGEVMARRVAEISPLCAVTVVDDFVTADNAVALVPAHGIVVDAIDQPRAKAAMAALCHGRSQPLVMCGGAGAVTDGLSLRRADLSHTRGDPLLAAVRARLRREHGFPREAGRAFGVEALYFPAARGGARAGAPARSTAALAGDGNGEQGGDALACAVEPGAPLACAGYGSLVTVTAALGLAAAGRALEIAAGMDARAAHGVRPPRDRRA